jgi:site-specific DNA-cytosine methylase
MTEVRDIKHFHFCCGVGGAALGFNRGRAEANGLRGNFRCLGGVDCDPAVIRDFTRRTGTRGTVLDLFDHQQYADFHGHLPPADWREATPEDIQRAAGYERPNLVFISAPCKGFSGLLSESRSKSGKYQALNQLALRCIWLMCEAWSDDPPELIVFENVPRIATRGRSLLDRISALANAYGYACAETFHDCGEIGGLAQSRKRFLMVMRHVAKVPAFLYEPPKRPLRAVGEILEQLPLPGDMRGGPMHSLPNLQWKTWVRLAFVEAGSDWRSLNKLRVVDGKLADYLLIPERLRNDNLGVTEWTEPSGTITGDARTGKGGFAVADPRCDGEHSYSQYGVRSWNQPSATLTAHRSPGQGPFSVADPRAASKVFSGHGVASWDAPSGAVAGESWPTNGQFAVADPRFSYGEHTHKNVFRVVHWDEASQTISSGHGPSSGGMNVADPRFSTSDNSHQNIMRIVGYDEPANAITGASHVTGGASCIADPRTGWARHSNNLTVERWDEPSKTVIGGGKGVQGGWLSIADPRWPNSQGEHTGKYHVIPYDEPARTITGNDRIGSGALCVADPRAGLKNRNGQDREKGDDYLTGGQYGVVPWTNPSYAVSGAAQHDSGPWNVADPRMPEPAEKVSALIISLDNTWHRPFTTLELAALQSLVDPGELFGPEAFNYDGKSDSAKRERIGNAVPPAAAQAIADTMGHTLLLAWSGQTFALSCLPIWVRPVAVALSVDVPVE